MTYLSAASLADQAAASARIARSHANRDQYVLQQLAAAVDSLSQAVAQLARSLDSAS